VATVSLSPRCLKDLEGIFEFIAQSDPQSAIATVRRIREAVEILKGHPLIGRKVEGGYRELVISRGQYGYIALYRWYEEFDDVLVLSIKHQREAGYGGE
jgi:plasmid stabilization system protein ParE